MFCFLATPRPYVIISPTGGLSGLSGLSGVNGVNGVDGVDDDDPGECSCLFFCLLLFFCFRILNI